jgi:hypothetical protein
LSHLLPRLLCWEQFFSSHGYSSGLIDIGSISNNCFGLLSDRLRLFNNSLGLNLILISGLSLSLLSNLCFFSSLDSSLLLLCISCGSCLLLLGLKLSLSLSFSLSLDLRSDSYILGLNLGLIHCLSSRIRLNCCILLFSYLLHLLIRIFSCSLDLLISCRNFFSRLSCSLVSCLSVRWFVFEIGVKERI